MAQKAPKQDNTDIPATIPSPKDDDSRLKEQDGQNRLLSEDQFMNRERLMGNE